QIRAYVMTRLLGIADKEAYGQALTANERMALGWLNERLIQPEQLIAKAAHEEWQRWSNLRCAYAPPQAPSWVPQPLGLPQNVRDYCNNSRSFANIFTFAATPSVEDFRTWGLYRVARESGLALLGPDLTSAGAEGATVGTIGAYVQLGGFAAGVAAGTAVYAGLAASSVAATAVATAMGSSIAASIPAFPAWIAAGPAMSAAAGVTAGAAVVTTVLISLVTLAVSSVQFHEMQQIGPTLAASAAATAATDDPLGLRALQAQNVGKPFPQDVLAHPPAYRTNGIESRLASLVANNVAVGSERTGTWLDAEHTTFDLRFRQGTQNVNQVTIPKADGTTSTVWFSKGWFIEEDSAGVRRPTLSLDYINAQGRPEQAWRSGDSFYVLTYHEGPDKTASVTTRTGALHFQGQSLLVDLAEREEELVGGVRPGAAGLLLPGVPVHLRPNPYHANGNFSLEDFLDGYVYTWQVNRVHADGTATPVTFDYRAQGSNARYGARFIPTSPGAYSATVTVTKPGDPEAVPLTGRVDFQISEPDVTIPVLALHDDGRTQLRVQMQLEQKTGLEGQIDVQVQWPGLIGSDDPGPVTSVTVTCLRYDFVTCTTPDSDLSNEFGTALRHTLSPESDLTDGVIVTVSTPGGATRTQRLEIDQSLRLAFEEGPGLREGQQGGIFFHPRLTSLTVPAAVEDNIAAYAVAAVANVNDAEYVSIIDPETNGPAAAVDLFPDGDKAGRFLASVDERDGRWLLFIGATPRPDDIGSVTVPISVWASDGRRANIRVTINTLVAPDDKYRGVLNNDINPLDFTVDHLPAMTPDIAGGAAEWDAYDGEVCLGLDGQSLCGPVAEIVGDGDNPFPFDKLLPRGFERGPHRASVWLPEGSDQAWEIPVSVTFALRSSPPVVAGLSWDTTVLHATITPGAHNDTGAPIPLDRVECTLDGGAPVTCFDGGDSQTWNPGTLTAGPHELRLRVVDTAGNYATHTLEFDRDAPSSELIETYVAAPSHDGNVVTIPDSLPEVEYLDVDTNTALTPGKHQLTGTLSVKARALPGYVIVPGRPTEWTFVADPNLIEVGVPAPVLNDNILMLPQPLPAGVYYVNEWTGGHFSGSTFEMLPDDPELVVHARPEEGYTFSAETVTDWVFAYSEEPPLTLGIADASAPQTKPVGGTFDRYVVIVRDADGKPVAGRAVTFEIGQGATFGDGGPTVQRVITDSNGIAGTSLPVIATSVGPVTATARLALGDAIPLGGRTVAASSPASAEVVVRPEAVGGRVRYVFEITNTSAVPLTAQLRTRFGTKAIPSFAPGTKATVTINTGLRAVEAGEGVLALTSATGTHEIAVAYPAADGAPAS
ncbi:MAG TPA: Ig-like domain-containing protein, partial [Arachnia sp.]|nr:Ig-like domain-containing protein [Arachnia sp.]